MSEKDEPLTAREFERLMAAVGLEAPGPPVAVAVSGGADSLALALLARDWGEVTALVFDHGLRSGSADEAKKTAGRLEAAGIPAVILEWSADKPQSGIQAAARAARYAALEGWCRAQGVGHLLLGHHLDDQAETFLMRLARGSGIDGLSAMAPVAPPLSRPDGPRLCRPLLGVPKARLVATLKERGQEWIEDPSNEDPSYLRNRVRRWLADSDIEGLGAARLAETAGRLAAIRAYLDQVTVDYLRLMARYDPSGYVELSPDFTQAAHREIGLRALARVLMAVAGGDYPPRQARLERLFDDIGRGAFEGATLAGCRVLDDDRAPSHTLLIVREEAALKGPVEVAPGESRLWDGRFLVDYRGGDGRLELRALGEADWKRLVDDLSPAEDYFYPAAAGAVLPSLWRAGKLVGVPHLDYWPEGRVDVAVGPAATRWLWEPDGEIT